MSITILGIESSCDDTSAAVIRDGVILSNVISSQKVHEQYGGVVPELASRAHQQNIIPTIDAAIKNAGIGLDEISAVAFTRGPGLLGSLLVGTSFAKGFALARKLPLIEVNHLQVKPDDLMKFGLIPEFIGRLPVTVALDKLDRDALVRVLTEPRNAIIKQYKKMLKMDDVELVFEDDAIKAIADKAIEQNTGARGLRSIIEESMRDVMYNIPSEKDVKECIIKRETIEEGKQPVLIYKNGTQTREFSEAAVNSTALGVS